MESKTQRGQWNLDQDHVIALLIGKGIGFYCLKQILPFIVCQVSIENTWAAVQIPVEINKLKFSSGHSWTH